MWENQNMSLVFTETQCTHKLNVRSREIEKEHQIEATEMFLMNKILF